MLPKPDACRACPYYGDGRGFVPAELRQGAPVLVMAQNPGESEEQGRRYLGNESWEPTEPRPLIGRTGRIMERAFLPLAGLTRDDVSLDNAIRCRIKHKNDVPPLRDKQFREAIRYCQHHHGRESGAHTYVAMGEPAMYALTGKAEGFSAWRGYALPRYRFEGPFSPTTGIWTPGPVTVSSPEPVLVVHHLAYLFREPQAELPAKADWNKLGMLMRREWPRAMGQIHSTSPDPWPPLAAFDTEFGREGKQLVRWSLATPDREVWVVERKPGEMIRVPDYSTLVMHNAAADLPFVQLSPKVVIEDTMYAHAVLWTGAVETDEGRSKAGGTMSHTLNFLGSMYSHLNRWKHLSTSHPRIYSGADALGTMDAWQTGLRGGIKAELARDLGSAFVYETLQKPLIHIIMKARQWGIKTNAEAIKDARKSLETRQQAQILRAQLSAGWPLKLSSTKQLAYWLYQVERVRAVR